jgi:mitogen-activated protein kinase kinase 1
MPPKRLALKIEDSAPAQPETTVSSSGTFSHGAFEINRFGVVGSHVQLDDDAHTLIPSLDDLTLVQRLGQGASGTVHLMSHPRSNTLLAVKNITVFDAGKRLQITKELETLAHAKHPNIVKFYGAFYSEGAIALVLEYMDQGSLGDIVAAYGPLPEAAIAKVAENVLLGLHYMHKTLHCVHRDIKPSNLLLNARGEIKISDFGVSAQVEHTAAECATFVGTVTYMSPERISGGTYSNAADVWALGLSVIELALGEFPYKKVQGREMVFWDLLNVVKSQPPPTLPQGDFSPEMRSFVEMCLRKDPAERPTCSELLNHPWIISHALSGVNMVECVQQLKARGMRTGAAERQMTPDELEQMLASQLDKVM